MFCADVLIASSSLLPLFYPTLSLSCVTHRKTLPCFPPQLALSQSDPLRRVRENKNPSYPSA
jgi:hypothetical protein